MKRGEEDAADGIDAQLIVQQGGVGIGGDVRDGLELGGKVLVEFGAVNAVFLELGQALDISDQGAIGDVDVQLGRLVQEEELTPGILRQLRLGDVMAPPLQFFQDQGIAGAAHRVGKIGHRKVLAVDAPEIGGGVSARSEKAPRVAVKKEAEADYSQDYDQHGLRLAAKKFHHKKRGRGKAVRSVPLRREAETPSEPGNVSWA